jgi:hypothetical protein
MFDFFGCDVCPYARIDQMGLVWLLNSNQLVDLNEHVAIIEKRSGVRQTWRRKPSEPGRALAWDLSDDG